MLLVLLAPLPFGFRMALAHGGHRATFLLPFPRLPLQQLAPAVRQPAIPRVPSTRDIRPAAPLPQARSRRPTPTPGAKPRCYGKMLWFHGRSCSLGIARGGRYSSSGASSSLVPNTRFLSLARDQPLQSLPEASGVSPHDRLFGRRGIERPLRGSGKRLPRRKRRKDPRNQIEGDRTIAKEREGGGRRGKERLLAPCPIPPKDTEKNTLRYARPRTKRPKDCGRSEDRK